jgi:hypothetical protein
MENVSEKLLSIDVGMKNLGFCLFQYDPNSNSKQKSYKILKWDVVNICEEKPILCCHREKQNQCTKQAKYTKGGEYFCKKHATTYAIPSSQMDMRKIKKMKLTQLYDFADKHEIDYIKPMLKTKLLENIENHINNTYFQVVQPVRAADINLITLGRTLKTKFDLLFACDFIDLNKVIIENQISPLASRMKTLQGMITQYFIMRCNANIDFVSSENKLKCDGLSEEVSNANYNERKKLSVKQTKSLLEDKQMNEWMSLFEKHKKKDDLADAYLQGMYFLQFKI